MGNLNDPSEKGKVTLAGTRVAYVLPSLDIGGMERFTIDLVKAVQARGLVPAVVCTTQPGTWVGELHGDGVPVLTMRERAGIGALWPSRLAAWLRDWRPELVHSQSGSWAQGALAAWRADVPARCHTEHGLISDPEPAKLVFTKRIASRVTHAVTAVSEPLQRAVAQQLGWPVDRVQYISNGIEISKYAASASRRADAREELRAADDEFLIGVVARLDPIKGIDVLLEAFGALGAAGARARVVLVGDGPAGEALRGMAATLPQAVTFLGSRGDVPRLLQAFDLFVLPSRSEALPLAVLEAMASGVPVLASGVGQLPRILGDGCGEIVPPGDVSALRDALRRILSGRARSEGATMRALDRVTREFSHQAMVDTYLRLYEEQLACSREHSRHV